MIPFNRPCLTGNESAYMLDAVRRGHISGDGHYTQKCVELLETILGAQRVLLTTSCTHALEMTALLCGIGPRDEVIVPSFTFVSTANAFALFGARPIFCDIDPDTLCMNVEHAGHLVSERTRAIVPVHYAGIGCDMEAVSQLALRTGIRVIEDNAHGLFGKRSNRWLGTIGDFGTLSFHETKNFHCGEGGALIVNAPEFVERAEIIREKGTDRSRFFRGEVDRYSWVDLGSSYLPSDLLAAYLLAQLEARELIQERRAAIFGRYSEGLAGWARYNEIKLISVPESCEPAFHLFYLLLPEPNHRDALIAHLRRRNIHAVFHYLPLHLSEMGRKYGGKLGDCPVTEWVSSRLVRLPFYLDLTDQDVDRVVAAVCEFSPA